MAELYDESYRAATDVLTLFCLTPPGLGRPPPQEFPMMLWGLPLNILFSSRLLKVCRVIIATGGFHTSPSCILPALCS